MKARIYQPSQTAMQSGMAKTHQWILEYESDSDRAAEPLMGWVPSQDTMEQVRLKFATLDEAEAFAKDRAMDYTVLPPREKRIKPRNFSDNFKYVPPEDTSD